MGSVSSKRKKKKKKEQSVGKSECAIKESLEKERGALPIDELRADAEKEAMESERADIIAAMKRVTGSKRREMKSASDEKEDCGDSSQAFDTDGFSKADGSLLKAWQTGQRVDENDKKRKYGERKWQVGDGVVHCVAILEDRSDIGWMSRKLDNDRSECRAFIVAGFRGEARSAQIKIYHPITGKVVRTLQGHKFAVLSLVVFEDRSFCRALDDGTRCTTFIVSGGSDRTVKIWNPVTSTALRSFYNRYSVSCVAVIRGSSDMKWRRKMDPQTARKRKKATCNVFVVIGSEVGSSRDNPISIWNLWTEKCVKKFDDENDGAHNDNVTCFAVLDNGTKRVRVFSGSKDTTIKIWDPSTGSCMMTLEGHSSEVTSVALLKDLSVRNSLSQSLCGGDDACRVFVVSGSVDGFVKIWNLRTGTCVRTLNHTINVQGVSSVAVLERQSKDGPVILSAGFDGVIKMWSPDKKDCVATCRDPKNTDTAITSIAVLRDISHNGSISRALCEGNSVFYNLIVCSTKDRRIEIRNPLFQNQRRLTGNLDEMFRIIRGEGDFVSRKTIRSFRRKRRAVADNSFIWACDSLVQIFQRRVKMFEKEYLQKMREGFNSSLSKDSMFVMRSPKVEANEVKPRLKGSKSPHLSANFAISVRLTNIFDRLYSLLTSKSVSEPLMVAVLAVFEAKFNAAWLEFIAAVREYSGSKRPMNDAKKVEDPERKLLAKQYISRQMLEIVSLLDAAAAVGHPKITCAILRTLLHSKYLDLSMLIHFDRHLNEGTLIVDKLLKIFSGTSAQINNFVYRLLISSKLGSDEALKHENDIVSFNLRKLDITTLPDNFFEHVPIVFPKLNHLDLSQNRLVQIPASIKCMGAQLTGLDLSNNPRLSELPKEIVELKGLVAVEGFSFFSRRHLQSRLDISGNELTLKKPPFAVCKRGIEAIRAWWDEVEANLGDVEKAFDKKVIFIGAGNAGKTSLRMNLTVKLGEKTTEGHDRATIGIEVEPLRLGDSVHLMLWDFGGQEEYYQTHALFLTPRSVYLLVVDIAAYDCTSTHYKRHVEQWIDALNTRVRSNAPLRIVVIATKIDAVLSELNEDADTALFASTKSVENEVKAQSNNVFESPLEIRRSDKKYVRQNYVSMEMEIEALRNTAVEAPLDSCRPESKYVLEMRLEDLFKRLDDTRKRYHSTRSESSPLLLLPTSTSEIHRISSSSGEGVNKLREHIKRLARENPVYMAKSWMVLRDKLRSYKPKNPNQSSTSSLRTVSLPDAAKIAVQVAGELFDKKKMKRMNKKKIQENARSALRLFHDLGWILWYEDIDGLMNKIFTDPSQLIHVLRNIVRHNMPHHIETLLKSERLKESEAGETISALKRGVLSRRLLLATLDDPKHADAVIAVCTRLDVLVPFRRSAVVDGYFVPFYMSNVPVARMGNAQVLRLTGLRSLHISSVTRPKRIGRKYALETAYAPPGLFNRLLVRWVRLKPWTDWSAWRNGFTASYGVSSAVSAVWCKKKTILAIHATGKSTDDAWDCMWGMIEELRSILMEYNSLTFSLRAMRWTKSPDSVKSNVHSEDDCATPDLVEIDDESQSRPASALYPPVAIVKKRKSQDQKHISTSLRIACYARAARGRLHPFRCECETTQAQTLFASTVTRSEPIVCWFEKAKGPDKSDFYLHFRSSKNEDGETTSLRLSKCEDVTLESTEGTFVRLTNYENERSDFVFKKIAAHDDDDDFLLFRLALEDRLMYAGGMVKIPYEVLRKGWNPKPIGRGTFGTAYETIYKKERVAVKCIARNRLDSKALHRELQVMKRLRRHANIVRYDGHCDRDVDTIAGSEFCIVMELCPTDLKKALQSICISRCAEAKRQWSLRNRWGTPFFWKTVVGIARGMKFMHISNNVTHLDLKPGNILLAGESLIPKIADFGTARILKQSGEQKGAYCGTPTYRPYMDIVDVKGGRGITYDPFKWDVYSFALIVWEMWTRMQPFSEFRSAAAIATKTSDGYRPTLDDNGSIEIVVKDRSKKIVRCDVSWPPSLRAFIASAWDGDKDKRPCFDEIVRNLEEGPMHKDAIRGQGRGWWSNGEGDGSTASSPAPAHAATKQN